MCPGIVYTIINVQMYRHLFGMAVNTILIRTLY